MKRLYVTNESFHHVVPNVVEQGGAHQERQPSYSSILTEQSRYPSVLVVSKK